MITIRLDGSEQVQRQLANAPAEIRTRVLKVVAKRVLQLSRQRTTKQTDLEGNRYKPHHIRLPPHKHRTRKMLTRLAKRMRIVSINDTETVIGWASSFEGMIAAKQQLGYTQTMNARKNDQEDKSPRGRVLTGPATRQQAQALLDVGYKRRVKAGWKTPSIKWIVSNITMKQAGVIIRKMRGSGNRATWTTTLPPRSFLGVSHADINELIGLAVTEAEAAIRT